MSWIMIKLLVGNHRLILLGKWLRFFFQNLSPDLNDVIMCLLMLWSSFLSERTENRRLASIIFPIDSGFTPYFSSTYCYCFPLNLVRLLLCFLLIPVFPDIPVRFVFYLRTTIFFLQKLHLPLIIYLETLTSHWLTLICCPCLASSFLAAKPFLATPASRSFSSRAEAPSSSHIFGQLVELAYSSLPSQQSRNYLVWD